jgi:signal transduction histidine kinase
LIVAGHRGIVDEARGEFARGVALSLAVLGALLAIASWLQVGAGLAPLNALRDRLGKLRQGQSQRLEGTYPTELAGLVEDLNRLLATQAAEVERARGNAAKLGHGLKTPLAILATEARALREQGHAAAAGAIEHEIEAMNAQVARILAAVRAVGPRKAVGARTPLLPLLERLVGVMKKLPRGDEIAWRVKLPGDEIRLPVDGRDLEDLFGNLLDNARKWATAKVDVEIRQEPAAILVVIEDDGPGIPEARRGDVMDKGVRLDRTVPGTGIGLAIARGLVELHGGQLDLLASKAGGTRVEVLLPTERR